MTASMSIIGLYNYDPTIFDDMEVPGNINKGTLINVILERCGGLEVLYPSAPFMKTAIYYWSDANRQAFQRMANSEQLEYNPIWNKDGTIHETIDSNGTNKNINSVKGFNSDSWADAAQNDGNSTGKISRTRTEQGNIGVTTTQEMIRQEREISAFSVYYWIADRFKESFCLMIY